MRNPPPDVESAREEGAAGFSFLFFVQKGILIIECWYAQVFLDRGMDMAIITPPQASLHRPQTAPATMGASV